jgi:sigma-B regulation protein RsbU (phosphoserine phosphatase)
VAGHNPPILAGPGREPFHLTSRHGFPLGVVPGAEFQDTQVELRPGDTTLLYSDGLTEAMGKDGSRYGEARLCEQLRRRIADPPVGILDDLRRDFEAFSGQSEQEDDVTLVAARLRKDV